MQGSQETAQGRADQQEHAPPEDRARAQMTGMHPV